MVGKQVLIAEDEPSIIEALSFILTREDFHVMVEQDGTAALNRALSSQPDVMILDIMLPGMNGIEVLKQIRTEYSMEKLPIIMLTAKGQSQDRQLSLDIGANLFISKPFDNQDVVDSVRRLAAG
jgi:DNA-binding response OmpR family regulator